MNVIYFSDNMYILYFFECKGDQIEYVDESVKITADIVENSPITIGAKKVPHCFPLKVSILTVKSFYR